MSGKLPIPADHPQLGALAIELIGQGRRADGEYVMALIKTDLAELHRLPAGKSWPRPGQAPPLGWTVYERVLEALHGGLDL